MAEEKKAEGVKLEPIVIKTGAHRCNARPVNPFASPQTPAQELLAEVFDCSGWKRDSNHKCNNQDKIIASLNELGPESPYAKATDEVTGIHGIHGCAVNGYTELLIAFMEKGLVSPHQKAEGLSGKVSWVKRQCGAGVDCLWLAKRRGHKAIVAHLLAMPVVQDEIKRFEIALVEKHVELAAAETERNAAAEAERIKKEEEEKQRLEEERKVSTPRIILNPPPPTHKH